MPIDTGSEQGFIKFLARQLSCHVVVRLYIISNGSKTQ